MSHYRTNLRDIRFNLFELHHLENLLPNFSLDLPTAHLLLDELDRLATNEFAASFEEGDRYPPKLVDGEVRLPDGIKRSLDAFYDGGWHTFGLSARLGGTDAPPSLQWALHELMTGANPAAYLYTSGILMARILEETGTDEQVEQWARRMIEDRWGGTMVLTEADAGSDVGAGTTKAIHVEGDTYHLEGVKRFITSGEGDYFENIIHLVLARPEGAEPGTKGLSMFIVPKYLVADDGSLGERNGIVCTRVDDKMGIKGSTTCELVLGGDRPCVGYLVGGVHKGIRQMFQVIHHARMMIAAKSVATLSTGYLNALEFATERIQGPDLTRATDKAAPRVPIIRHPDVRRMLMEQKAWAEGLRALLYYIASNQDQAVLHPDDSAWMQRDNLLLPVIKGYAAEKAYELLGQSLQVLGGSGFTTDYPIEQYIRDVKIDSLYEGTTGIQGLDLFFRQVVRDRGANLTALLDEVQEFIKGGEADDLLAGERELLDEALDALRGQLGVMVEHLMAFGDKASEIYLVGLHTNGFLDSLAEVVIGWLLLRQAEVALRALPTVEDPDDAFYEGKVASARFFCRHALPGVVHRRTLAEQEDGSLMELPVEAF